MSQLVVGPSPFDVEHSSLHQRLTQLHADIGRLTAEAATVEQQIEQTLIKKHSWTQQEHARLQQQENDRLERERLEQQRLEQERLDKERLERERLEQEEQQRIVRERAETEARLEAEKQAKQAEKERLEREWMEREKQEQLVREENERKRHETEAALAAAAAGAIAAQSASTTIVVASDSAAAGSLANGGVAPTELHARARALYDLDGDEANDELSFVTGDVFTVSGEMNGWMSARHERTGKVGLVPSNYIQVIEQLEPATTIAGIDTLPMEESQEQLTTSTSTTATATTSASATRAAISDSSVKGKGKGECVIALFDFAGENDDEISFSAGQRLWKTGEVNGWFIGTLDGSTERVGIFPSNFVEPAPATLGDASDEMGPGAAVGGMAGKAAFSGVSAQSMDRDETNQRAILSAAPPHVSRTKSTAFAAAEVATLAQMAADSQAPDTPRLSVSGRRPSLPASAVAGGALVGGIEPDAIALYRFQATSNDQLSFDKGAKLLIKATLNGWYVGQEIGRDALGIFPANYVQKLDKSEQAVVATTVAGSVVKAEDINGSRVAGAMVDDDGSNEQSYRYKQRHDAPASSTAAVSTSQQQTTPAGEASVVIGRVTALYDFNSTTADSLSFAKGDEIAVVKEIKGWWAGSVVGRDGKLGLVPSNYCTALRPEPAVAGASVVGGQYPVVGTAAGGVVRDMKVEQVIMPTHQVQQVQQVQPMQASAMAVNTAAATTTIAPSAYNGVVNASAAASPSSMVGRQSGGGGSAPPLLSAKPALLSSLATQANGGSTNLAVGSRPSLQPVQSVQSAQPVASVQNVQSVQPVQPVQFTQSIAQPIAVIEPTATAAVINAATSNATTATTTTTTPATANAPGLTTTHTPAVVVAAPSTATTTSTIVPTTTTTNTASSSSAAAPAVAAAALAAQSSFVRQPSDRLAIAEHDWDTTERGELSFKKDDRIIVTREKNGWYTGYVEGTGRKGMFPSTFVRMLQENGQVGDVKGAAMPSTVVAASIAPTVTNTPVTSRPPSPTNGHVRASSTSMSQSSMNQQPGAASPSYSTSASTAPASAAATADPSSHPALVALGNGVQVTKLDSHGYPKMVRMYVERERLSRGKRGEWIVRWDTKKFNKREAQLTLAKCRVKRGLKVQEAGGTGVQNAFTVLGQMRNLQVICASEADRETWMQAFSALGVQLENGSGSATSTSGSVASGGAVVVSGTSMNGSSGGSMSREQSMKRAGTPAPGSTTTTVADSEEVSMHDILAQGPPTPAASHVKVHDDSHVMAGRPASTTVGMVGVQQPLQPLQQPNMQQPNMQQPQQLQQLQQQPQRLQQPAAGGARIVQALYDFGSEAEDLVMVAGDRIELVEANPEEQWWRGRNLTKPGSRTGMFPRSYVSEVVETFAVLKPVASLTSMNSISQASVAGGGSGSRPSSRASNGPVTMTPAVATTTASTFTPIATLTPPSSALPASAVSSGIHPKVRALYDFETDLVKHPNDLPFKQGEMLTLLSKDNEWWTGVDSRGRKGMFPAAFVKEIM